MSITVIDNSLRDITVQFTYADGSQSPMTAFVDTDTQYFTISGSQVSGPGAITLTVYDGSGANMQTFPSGSTRAHWFGDGSVTYVVDPNLRPIPWGRTDLLCFFGECGLW
ncbi:unnamed protein product, partial [Mesorhabditis belari]|uniref:Uncharacterized protein n=1 Tax=Mesorhabditis belari TaxID=2138241 RepID=A0AAF3FNG9_9BILA